MTLLRRVRSLPDDFVWGGATAAYQVEGATKEGGKGPTLWDPFLPSQGRFLPDPASDFYHRYAEDIGLASAHGLNALRVSIAWTRIFPTGSGQPNREGVNFYHSLFRSCLDHGIEPYVTLHHFDSPLSINEDGDWLERNNINLFIDYARFCFSEFGEIKNWFTINEPITLSVDQYIMGGFPPCHRFDVSSAVQVQHNLNLAHAMAVNVFHELGASGRIGVIHVIKPAYPDNPDSAADLHSAELYDAFYNRLLLDGSLVGKYSDETLGLFDEIMSANNAHAEFPETDLDVMGDAVSRNGLFGVNYYQNQFVRSYSGDSEAHHNGTGDKGTASFRFRGVGEAVKHAGVPTTDWDWNIYPQGLYDVLTRIRRDYPKAPTLYVTENGLGAKDPVPGEDGIVRDPDRIDFIDRHVEALLRARNEGVDVQGYFVWSLQDQFSWTNGYNKRYGLFYVDFENQRRYVKQSALWYKELSETIHSGGKQEA